MEKRRERLDRLFEIGLALLGILMLVEFQIFIVKTTIINFLYVLRIFTTPLLILTVILLVKELLDDKLRLDYKMILTEFSWDFWSFTLFLYPLWIVGQFENGIIMSFLLSSALIALIIWAYARASSVSQENQNMNNYYNDFSWMLLRFLAAFAGSYFLLIYITA